MNYSKYYKFNNELFKISSAGIFIGIYKYYGYWFYENGFYTNTSIVNRMNISTEVIRERIDRVINNGIEMTKERMDIERDKYNMMKELRK